MPLPGSTGFYSSAVRPHPLRIQQQGCERLLLFTRLKGPSVDDPRAPDHDKLIALGLTRVWGRTVDWGPDSLNWRQRYTPSYFGWPWLCYYIDLHLRRLADGSLEYRLRQESRRHVKGEIRCILPPVVDGSERADGGERLAS